MMRLWKSFRVNMMYWRFRNITRNRLRLQAWYRNRGGPTNLYRARGTASIIYRHSARRTWLALIIVVAVLTALQVFESNGLNRSLGYLFSTLAIVLGLYWTMRGI